MPTRCLDSYLEEAAIRMNFQGWSGTTFEIRTEGQGGIIAYMKPGIFFLPLAVFLWVSVSVFAAERMWTNAEGAGSFNAELLSIEDEKVRLRKSDGSTVELSLEHLSEADRTFLAEVKNQARGQGNEGKEAHATGSGAGEERECGGMTLCWLPAGRFIMGNMEQGDDEDPAELELWDTFLRGEWDLTTGSPKRDDSEGRVAVARGAGLRLRDRTHFSPCLTTASRPCLAPTPPREGVGRYARKQPLASTFGAKGHSFSLLCRPSACVPHGDQPLTTAKVAEPVGIRQRQRHTQALEAPSKSP